MLHDRLDDVTMVTLSYRSDHMVLEIDTTHPEVYHFWRRYTAVCGKYVPSTADVVCDAKDTFLFTLSRFGNWCAKYENRLPAVELGYEQARVGKALDRLDSILSSHDQNS